MRLAALGLCLSGFIVTALPSPTHATLAYKAKTDAMTEAPGQNVAIGNQSIIGNDDGSYSPYLFGQEIPGAEVLPLDRSFRGEIAEVVDKEQLEIRNGEN